MMDRQPTVEEIETFKSLIDKYRYDYVKLAYLIFGFGAEGPCENMEPYDWQVREWVKLSNHLSNPATRYVPYKMIVSSGNGAAKTAFGAMTVLMLMYTQQVRGRITANTLPQMQSIVWPEYDIWCQRAKYFNVFFEKLGTSIKSRDETLAESWRMDTVTWSENNPVAMSGLHNARKAVVLVFEEGPGIPGIIWQYAHGCFSDEDTIRVWLAFGNSDDPNSYFEQKMNDPEWRSLRIDTRTLKHVSKDFVAAILKECLGDEDADDFRVRVRGLPRKSARDSIIPYNLVEDALNRPVDFKKNEMLPCVMTCDPAWQGGDETTIWIHQGDASLMVDKYKLNKEAGQTHAYTYAKMCKFEKEYRVDQVLIDQGEGTTLFTLAINDGKTNWQLVSFSEAANDAAEFRDSQYQNIRAQMHYEAREWLNQGGAIDALPGLNDDETRDKRRDEIQKQLTWTRGDRNAKTLKKQAESKIEIKNRVGRSPDVNDGFILRFARKFYDRQPENVVYLDGHAGDSIGPVQQNNDHYEENMYDIEATYRRL